MAADRTIRLAWINAKLHALDVNHEMVWDRPPIGLGRVDVEAQVWEYGPFGIAVRPLRAKHCILYDAIICVVIVVGNV